MRHTIRAKAVFANEVIVHSSRAAPSGRMGGCTGTTATLTARTGARACTADEARAYSLTGATPLPEL